MDNWQLAASEGNPGENVSTFTRSDSPDNLMYRMEVEFPNSDLEEITRLIFDAEARMTWESVSFDNIKVVEDFGLGTQMTYATMAPFWPVFPRELLGLQQIMVDGDTTWVYMESTEDDAYPITDERIRAHVYKNIYRLDPMPEHDGYRMQMMVELTAGGWILEQIIEILAVHNGQSNYRRLVDFCNR